MNWKRHSTGPLTILILPESWPSFTNTSPAGPLPCLRRRTPPGNSAARISTSNSRGLANTGAHKINNALGQALLAKKLGKTRIIAETGAGQHGVATASVCARLGLDCDIYMGTEDIRRQHPNVFWMELFGARVIPVDSGSRTLKDAVNQAFRGLDFQLQDYPLPIGIGPLDLIPIRRWSEGSVGHRKRGKGSGRFRHRRPGCLRWRGLQRHRLFSPPGSTGNHPG